MAEALAMPHHHYAGRWTIDEVVALPEDGMRRELVEGRLVESPVPAKPHQMAGKRLEQLLDRCSPPELEAIREMNLKIGADLLIPDVMVAPPMCSPSRAISSTRPTWSSWPRS